jgi:thiol-disulfide isomerase/thioredoxin
MLKVNSLKFYSLGLVFLLSACNSVEASQPAPVEEAPAEAVEIETQVEASKVEMAEPPMEAAEKPAAVVEEVAPAEAAPLAAVEEVTPATEEVMTKVEETAPVVEEAAAMAEAVSDNEEQVMPEEASVVEAGPTEAQLQLLAGLENQGMPPELFNEVWLNSEPLKLADLHGKVVIVEFWTFACYNCKNVVPSLREWHQKYADEGLVIIGVHTPEFGFEREIENVKQALVDQDIPYAVAIDNDWQTWRAYNNRYWPAKYFVDKAGNLRHIHIGEGRYEQQEEIIQALLAENLS